MKPLLPSRPRGMILMELVVAIAIFGMVALGFTGIQATMPHKRACFDLVDHHTPAAKALGAVNTVIVEDDGTLTGENTDLPGFVEPLQGLDLTGEQVTVLGAGGAAAAVPAGRVTLPVKVGEASGAFRAVLPSSLLIAPRIESVAATVPADELKPVRALPETVVAAMAATWLCSTRSYSARCGPLNVPLAGKLRVMSLA